MTRCIITAGFDRALHAVVLAELLKREGHAVTDLIVVSPVRADRVRRMLRERGIHGLVTAAKRWLGLQAEDVARSDLLLQRFASDQGITDTSLRSWARRTGADYHGVASINEASVAEVVRERNPDVVCYGGGGIIRDELITAAEGRILNAHAGPLPEIRGMNACEWSLLLGYEPTVTIHFINRGIDTGAIIDRIPVPVKSGDDVAELRSRCTVYGVKGLVDTVGSLDQTPVPTARPAADYRQCFRMAPALLDILERRLKEGWYVTDGSE